MLQAGNPLGLPAPPHHWVLRGGNVSLSPAFDASARAALQEPSAGSGDALYSCPPAPRRAPSRAKGRPGRVCRCLQRLRAGRGAPSDARSSFGVGKWPKRRLRPVQSAEPAPLPARAEVRGWRAGACRKPRRGRLSRAAIAARGCCATPRRRRSGESEVAPAGRGAASRRGRPCPGPALAHFCRAAGGFGAAAAAGRR